MSISGKLNKSKVFVGMSGGVDSSVAALLLKKKGYDVVGVFMRCYNLDGCAEKDAEDARRVAEHLEIPFYVWDFEEEYKKKVVEYMVDGYRNGITPNPDVMCNKEIKFGLFLEKALAAGADFVATGHYIRIKKSSIVSSRRRPGSTLSEYSLSEAKDKNKDQSYFLWTLTQDQLKHCLFPIGDYVKPEVRVIARKAKLPTADKKDSQGICFLGNISIADFLKQYIPEKTGALVTTSGEKIGEHVGAEFYTIGQRHLGVGYRVSGIGSSKDKDKHKDQKPFYVASKDAQTNTVVVAEGNENPALYRKEIELTSLNFINSVKGHIRTNEPMKKIAVFARVRYRQPLSPAVLSCVDMKKGLWKLEFKRPQKFIASGQSAVFYNAKGPSAAKAMEGMEMLGGGIIR